VGPLPELVREALGVRQEIIVAEPRNLHVNQRARQRLWSGSASQGAPRKTPSMSVLAGRGDARPGIETSCGISGRRSVLRRR
jgi:hypothetical protein